MCHWEYDANNLEIPSLRFSRRKIAIMGVVNNQNGFVPPGRKIDILVESRGDREKHLKRNIWYGIRVI